MSKDKRKSRNYDQLRIIRLQTIDSLRHSTRMPVAGERQLQSMKMSSRPLRQRAVETKKFNRLCKQLERSTHKLSSDTLSILGACQPEIGRPCGCAGDIVCRNKMRKSFTRQMRRELREHKCVDYWAIIPPDGRVEYEQIDTFDIPAFTRRHQEKLRRILPSEIAVIGAVDVSLNSFNNKDLHWQFHFHLFFLAQIGPEAERLLRDRYVDPSGKITKPVLHKVVPSSGFETVARYTVKSEFVRRSSYIAVSNTGTREPYRASKTQELQSDDVVRLTMALRKYQVHDLLFLIGRKRKRSSDPTKVKLFSVNRT